MISKAVPRPRRRIARIDAGADLAPNGAGNVWTWTALDLHSKMILALEVGDRSAETAREFMFDLAGRLANRVQLTTDGYVVYLKAVGDALPSMFTTQCL